jgi:hypothetical protein
MLVGTWLYAMQIQKMPVKHCFWKLKKNANKLMAVISNFNNHILQSATGKWLQITSVRLVLSPHLLLAAYFVRFIGLLLLVRPTYFICNMWAFCQRCCAFDRRICTWKIDIWKNTQEERYSQIDDMLKAQHNLSLYQPPHMECGS